MRLLRIPTACAILATALFLPGSAVADPSHVKAATPSTIPALGEWAAASGTYTYSESSRLVVDPDHADELTDEAQTAAADLAALTGTEPEVVTGEPETGDVSLALGGGEPLGAEGYRLDVGDTFAITANADTGAFYGTRTLLQLVKQDKQIPAGTATDVPKKPERGLMVDVGRKYMSVEWLKKHIKDLSYAKLNYFHLHLSDTFGFRLESETHPEVTSEDHYTKDEIRELVDLAAKYHVTLVPEIDVPGHVNAMLAQHPELQLEDQSGNKDPYFLDLSNPDAYTLVEDLIKEYLPLFPGPYWHIGADEYVGDYGKYPQLEAYAKEHYGPDAVGKDAYYGFINWANEIVRDGGKTTRMWNDGIKEGDGTIAPEANIVVDYWSTHGIDPQKLLDRGHTVMNASWTPTYYVLGGTDIDRRWLYEDWNPDLFEKTLTIDDPKANLGSKIHVWCDHPDAQTEEQIAEGIRLPLRGLAQQTWGSPKLVEGYDDFVAIDDAIGRAPGFSSL